jgi:hypothetical protein
MLVLQDGGYGLAFVGPAYPVSTLAKLVAEIPTGYGGDWLGRRASLAVGSVVRAAVGRLPVPTAGRSPGSV